MNPLTLWQRLALVFAALLLACFAAAAALQMAHSTRFGQQIEQQLLRRLAMHLAADLASEMARSRRLPPGMTPPPPLKAVVERLRVTNPGVDLYLLDAAGGIEQRYPEVAPLQRREVALGPLRDFLAGKPPPILGDDPLNGSARKVFSVAVKPGDGEATGYVYAVLHGTAYDMAAAEAGRHDALQTALWSIGLVTPLGLVAGLLSFRWVTRPLTRLTAEVQAMTKVAGPEAMGLEVEPGHAPVPQRDEIAILREAFDRLARTNQRHWQSLAQQDQQRREWLAHVSHDLRTPLATMQGYLETVLLKAAPLNEETREHYLRTALSESQRLSRLAQALLDVARLELGAVRPVLETFSIVELAQDVMQKLALSALARQKLLVPDFMPGVRPVLADISMIERVLTNLLDNAIRHTPAGGEVCVRLQAVGDRVRVSVADQGPGIPDGLRAELIGQAGQRLPGRDGGGLGLAVVQQMLHLHGSGIALQEEAGWGAVFTFDLPRVA